MFDKNDVDNENDNYTDDDDDDNDDDGDDSDMCPIGWSLASATSCSYMPPMRLDAPVSRL